MGGVRDRCEILLSGQQGGFDEEGDDSVKDVKVFCPGALTMLSREAGTPSEGSFASGGAECQPSDLLA